MFIWFKELSSDKTLLELLSCVLTLVYALIFFNVSSNIIIWFGLGIIPIIFLFFIFVVKPRK